MQLDTSLRVTPRQLAQIEGLINDVGPDQAARYLKSFAGGSQLSDVAPWLTRREASSLVILLSVVADASRRSRAVLN